MYEFIMGLLNLTLWGGTYLHFVVRVFVIKGFSFGLILLGIFFSIPWLIYIFISLGSVITGMRLLLLSIKAIFVKNIDWDKESYDIKGEGFRLDATLQSMAIGIGIGIIIFWWIAR